MSGDVELNPGPMQPDSSLRVSASVRPFSNCTAVATVTTSGWEVPPWMLGPGLRVFPQRHWFAILLDTLSAFPFTSSCRATYFPSVCDQPTLDCSFLHSLEITSFISDSAGK
jgi:hypothetical protein